MRCVQPLPLKAAATMEVVVPSLSGRHLRRPCSTKLYGWPSRPSYLPSSSHILRAAKDGDDIAQPAAAAQPYMPEEWPDFSTKEVDPDIERRFFNRKEEYDMIMGDLNNIPKRPLLLLGPVNSGKSVRHIIGR